MAIMKVRRKAPGEAGEAWKCWRSPKNRRNFYAFADPQMSELHVSRIMLMLISRPHPPPPVPFDALSS